MSSLFDTHTHPHSSGYALDSAGVVAAARQAGVERMLCVGTDPDDSVRAVEFATRYEGCFASVGLHPHDAKLGSRTFNEIRNLILGEKVIAVGECGLDYFYAHSAKKDQEAALRFQIELAIEYNLPLVFHVREAFSDFWRIFDDYRGVRGVIHSFTGSVAVRDLAIQRGLLLGLNGIITFTKDEEQLVSARSAPLEYIVLETDAPFLTPHPFRGRVNEPRYVGLIAEFLANLRQESIEDFIKQTTQNAKLLFSIN